MIEVRNNWMPDNPNNAHFQLVVQGYQVAQVWAGPATLAEPTPKWFWQVTLNPAFGFGQNFGVQQPFLVQQHEQEVSCEEAMIKCERMVLERLEEVLSLLRNALTP